MGKTSKKLGFFWSSLYILLAILTLICTSAKKIEAVTNTTLNASLAYPTSPPWKAKWIWCKSEANPRNFYLYVRKAFDLSENVVKASLRITADSRYRLFINGIRIGQGPVKSDKNKLYYDEWEITQRSKDKEQEIKNIFKRGENVISILVHHYGEWTFSYMPGRGGLILEMDIETPGGQKKHIATDRTWKVMPSEAWRRDLSRMSIQQGFPEIYDARKSPLEWTNKQFNDTNWQDAVELGSPPLEPWLCLIPRQTPASFEKMVYPVRIIAQGDALPGPRYEGVNFLEMMHSNESLQGQTFNHNVAYAATYLYISEKATATFSLSSKSACKLWVGTKMLFTNYIGEGVDVDQTASHIELDAGWTLLLAKCVQRSAIWDFTLMIDTANRSKIFLSPDMNFVKKGWAVIGPFHTSGKIHSELNKIYPPQNELDFTKTYNGYGGQSLSWIITDDTDRTSTRLGHALSEIEMQPAHKSKIDKSSGTKIRTDAETSAYLILDFGKEVSGYPYIKVESKNGGEIIDLGYSEVLEDKKGRAISTLAHQSGRVNTARGGVNYADRYITRAGLQEWDTFEKRAFRYMLIVVRNAEKPIILKSVGLRFSTYNIEKRGRFESSNKLLNRIWEIGAYTLQLNMDDSYTDCPWRERGQWWGDARIEALVNYYAFGDQQLARRGILQIGESQREDGLVAGIYPTEWDNRWLPDYALIWIISAMDYYQFTGDNSLLPEILPRFQKLLDGFFLKYENKNHLLTDVPHWVFIDWAPVEKRGASMALNAFYYKALRDAAEQFRVAGDKTTASKYASKAEQVKKAINEFFWEPAEGIYVDCFALGKKCKTISQQSNTLSVLFDIAPITQQAAIMDYIMNPKRNIVRAGSPYFSYYILSALRHVGQDSQAMNYIKLWQTMVNWGATTWWEMWGTANSHCHAWSAAPTYDLSRYVLGISPTAPGFAKVRIEPRPIFLNGEKWKIENRKSPNYQITKLSNYQIIKSPNLSYASGVIPTPHGDISIRWESQQKKQNQKFRLTVTLPKNISGEIWLPIRKTKKLKLRINGKKILPVGVRQLGYKNNRLGLEFLYGGHYDITI